MRTVSSIIVLTLVFFFALLFFQDAFAVKKKGVIYNSGRIQDYKKIDVNTIRAWITNYGSIFRNPTSGNAGFEWPTGSGMYAIYASGLWIGAKVNNELRVAVAEYSYEYGPGTIDPVTHLPNDPNDPTYLVYKINQGDTNSWAYQNWPYWDGAPLDFNGKPLLMGDQTLWCVYNDADTAYHVNMGTNPLGIEIQQMAFGLDAWSGPFGKLVILRWLLINKGVNHLDSVYISVWSDPDLGGSGDDKVGCDTTLNLGFCYNADNYDNIYGASPPAVGYDYFQGPIVPSPGDTAFFMGKWKPGYKNLPLSSFVSYVNSNFINGNPGTAQEVYNYMRALWRDSSHITYGEDGTNPNNPPTNFMFTGDPVSGTGWLDPWPVDKRFLMNTGPLSMAPGDSQEIVVGVLIARGYDNKNSVTLLKMYDNVIQDVIFDSILVPIQNKPLRAPTHFTLYQNYPNPFNPETNIQFTVGRTAMVSLEVFNVLGERVKTLINRELGPGEYRVVWDAKDEANIPLCSGVYFYRLTAGKYVSARKMIFLR